MPLSYFKFQIKQNQIFCCKSTFTEKYRHLKENSKCILKQNLAEKQQQQNNNNKKKKQNKKKKKKKKKNVEAVFSWFKHLKSCEFWCAVYENRNKSLT